MDASIVGQSKKQSCIESFTNVIIGYLIAVGSQIIILPFFNVYIPIESNFIIGLWFTVVSLLRSYLLRRFFNTIKPKGVSNE